MLATLLREEALVVVTPGAATPIAARTVLTLRGEAVCQIHVQASLAEVQDHGRRLAAASAALLRRWRRFDLALQALGWLGALGASAGAFRQWEPLRAALLSLGLLAARQWGLPVVRRGLGRLLLYVLRRRLGP